jgi:penicillin-binding protein 2
MVQSTDIPDRREQGGLARYTGRYWWLAVCCGLAFTVILGRLWYIQIARGESYHRVSTENVIQDVEIDAPRGRIYGRDGIVLAENRTAFDVELRPHIVRDYDVERILGRLQSFLNLTDEQVETYAARIDEETQPIRVASDVTRSQVAAVETARFRLPGVEVRARSRRHYPLDEVAAHAVGFMGEVRAPELRSLRSYGYGRGDMIGRMGLEEAYEGVLKGGDGLDRRVVNARGMEAPESINKMMLGRSEDVPPVPGRDLKLTIDAGLQMIVHEEMAGFHSGAVVAMDPRDGGVLALYSKPGFNPNSWSGQLTQIEKSRTDNDPFKPMLDKTGRPYFPGSVYKISGAYAALDRNVFGHTEQVNCQGYYEFGGRKFRCWKWGGHGKVDILGALQHSCDVYFYKVADKLSIDVLADYAYRFGFGEKTGFRVNADAAGRVPTRRWHERHSPNGYQYGFALNTVLGQGNTMTTPLQMAVAYSAIANGGELYYPRLVSEITTREGRDLFEFEPEVRKHLGINDADLAAIRDGLERVVNREGGTAYEVRPTSVKMAGKTGTAQVHSIGDVRIPNREKRVRLRDHAWFAAYAPSDDPELVVVVFLEHAGHGGAKAAPVASAIVERYLSGDAASDALRRKVGEEVGRSGSESESETSTSSD